MMIIGSASQFPSVAATGRQPTEYATDPASMLRYGFRPAGHWLTGIRSRTAIRPNTGPMMAMPSRPLAYTEVGPTRHAMMNGGGGTCRAGGIALLSLPKWPLADLERVITRAGEDEPLIPMARLSVSAILTTVRSPSPSAMPPRG